MKCSYNRSIYEERVAKNHDVLTLDRHTTPLVSTLPKVAIIGRPNVGKSTLYNRISGSQNAVVYDCPGVTRDRLSCLANWNGIEFQISDTAGIVSISSSYRMKSECKKIEHSESTAFEIMQQMNLAINDSDVLIMVVDGLDGPTDHDNEIIRWIRRLYGDKQIILAVNKCDMQTKAEVQSSYFWELGLEPIPISAMIPSSVDNLLETIVSVLPRKSHHNKVSEEKHLRVTFIGRPNVGKSSLLNYILAKKRFEISVPVHSL
jgi:GTP-binding protein